LKETKPKPIGSIILGALAGICVFFVFAFINFFILAFIDNDLNGVFSLSTCDLKLVMSAIIESILIVIIAIIGFQAAVKGRPFRTAGVVLRTMWLTVAVVNLVPWPCSFSGQTFVVGQSVLSHCHT
jgi:hypothetical protein